MATASGVFISYRRDDSAGHARAIAAELARRLGPQRVFIDVDDIAPGQRFADTIAHAVAGASVLLVLIGPRWRGERPGGLPRVHDAGDFVRQEVAAGLRHGLHVVPVLLEGATVPTAGELPAELQPLAGLQAVPLDHARFEADLHRLLGALQPFLHPRSGLPPWGRRPWLAGVAALGLAAATVWRWRQPPQPVRQAVNGDWQAEVAYPWLATPQAERFSFMGERQSLHGSASFLGVPRGIVQGEVEGGTLRFSTRTQELGGATLVHRYTGQLAGDEIRFTLQTEGGSSPPGGPLQFTARRRPPA